MNTAGGNRPSTNGPQLIVSADVGKSKLASRSQLEAAVQPSDGSARGVDAHPLGLLTAFLSTSQSLRKRVPVYSWIQADQVMRQDVLS